MVVAELVLIPRRGRIMSQESGRQTLSDPIVSSECLESGKEIGSESPSLADSDLAGSEQCLRVSVNEMTTYRWSFLEDVLNYEELGIEGIGIWRPKLCECGEELARHVLVDSSLKVTSVSWAGGFTGVNGYSFADAIDDARDAIRLAASLKAECLVVLSGGRNGHIKSQMYRLLVDGLRELGDFAAERGLSLAVKPMHAMFARDWTFLNSLDHTLDVLDCVGHESVKLAFDVYHLWQEPRLLDRIRDIVGRVATVQLSDWREPPRTDNDHCSLGTGEIPLPWIIESFLQNGYEGFFDVQVWSEDLWRCNYFELLNQSLSYLRTVDANLRRHAIA